MHEPQEYFVYFKAWAAPDRGERADALPEKYVKSLLNKKGSGAICSPRIIAPVFALSDHLLLVTQTCPIRRTEPYDPLRGGGPEPCGR